MNRLCSAQYISANQFGEGIGTVDGIFFTGEETSGGTEYALDADTGDLWAVPSMGVAAWESVTEIDTGSTDKVAFLVGDDRAPAPLLLYVGEKDAVGDGSFLDRNGLAQGQLYVWVSDNGDVDPTDFRGTGNSRDGKFVEIDYYRPDLASEDGSSGYDSMGYATQAQQDELAGEVGAFSFSRPEDTATNPEDGTIAVFNSTGRSDLFDGVDSWGTTYTVDFDFSGDDIAAKIKAIYDGDDAGGGQFAGPDFGIRSQDNLDWADDGYIYIQEDRAFEPDFGATSGEEASIWRLDPNTSEAVRVAQIDRSAVPGNLSDSEPDDIGNWESSGIVDVSGLFDRNPGSLFLFDIQAHSLRDGAIADENLVEGSQLAFLSAPESNGETGGANFIVGAANDSTPLYGDDAANFIIGGSGNSELFGNGGNDTLKGDFEEPGGSDKLFAGKGDDLLLGGNGDDILLGESGNDTLLGEGGNDFLLGGAGSDVLFGGEGVDIFALTAGEGVDTIVDFEINNDLIGLSGGLSFGQLYRVQEGVNTVIGTYAGEVLSVVLNADASQFSESAFLTV